MFIDVKIKKRFGDWSLDAEFASSESPLVVWGKSGSGKSLTLQMICGLIRPDAGRIVVGGKTLFDAEAGVDLPPQKRRTGMVFQDYSLFPHISVKKNLAYGKPNAKATEDEIVETARKLGIEKHLDKSPEKLSGGQKQRVALGRAVLARPKVLLLDEPFNALDMETRNDMREFVKDVLVEYELPAVMVTHDLHDVRSLARSVVVYDNGRASECVDMPEMFMRPACREQSALCEFMRSLVPQDRGNDCTRSEGEKEMVCYEKVV